VASEWQSNAVAPDSETLGLLLQIHFVVVVELRAQDTAALPQNLLAADCIDRYPGLRTRHPHRRSIRWAVSTSGNLMFVSFGLKTPSRSLITPFSVVFG
jgi:hypothetical protein